MKRNILLICSLAYLFTFGLTADQSSLSSSPQADQTTTILEQTANAEAIDQAAQDATLAKCRRKDKYKPITLAECPCKNKNKSQDKNPLEAKCRGNKGKKHLHNMEIFACNHKNGCNCGKRMKALAGCPCKDKDKTKNNTPVNGSHEAILACECPPDDETPSTPAPTA